VIDIAELRTKRIVYTIPRMGHAMVTRNVAYKHADGITLEADVYRPGTAGLAPAVILVAGSGSWEILKDIKDWGVYRSYGELLAASGLGAITFNHRSPRESNLAAVADDIDDLIAWVRRHAAEYDLDPDRLALWAFSGGPPFGLRSVLRDAPPFVRCLVAYYGVMDYHHVIDEKRESCFPR
jgi:acetyl esterase/lipase